MTEVASRVVSPERRPDDWNDSRLRPRRLNEVIGQERVRENLAILVAAAQNPTHQADITADIGCGQIPAIISAFPVTYDITQGLILRFIYLVV